MNNDETVQTVKKEISRDLSNVRFRLLRDMPFIGHIAMRFNLVPVRDVRCPTACTDGTSIFFDCGFYEKMTADERLFVFAHEVWHCVLLHFARLQNRDPDVFNFATDMEVNYLLKKENLTPPKGLLFPPSEMEGKSAEEIYEWLLKNAKKQKSKKNGKSDNSGLNGQSDGNSDNGSDSSGLNGQFDRHEYENSGNSSDEGEKNISRGDKWGKYTFDDDFRPEISKGTAERMREAATASAQRYTRERGSLPAHIAGIIKTVLTPEVKWQDLLAQFVTNCYGSTRSWLPPNRRHVYNDTYFQSRRNSMIKGIVAIDTSGSCVDELPKFFSELKGLVDSFGSYEIKVLQADAKVDDVKDYDDYNPFPDDVKLVEWRGGGGTDYDCVFRYIDENCGERPNFLIYIGDGYANLTVKKPDYPVMWLITRDGTTDFVDWGKKIKFKNSAYSQS